jgi:hypothetical protein
MVQIEIEEMRLSKEKMDLIDVFNKYSADQSMIDRLIVTSPYID